MDLNYGKVTAAAWMKKEILQTYRLLAGLNNWPVQVIVESCHLPLEK